MKMSLSQPLKLNDSVKFFGDNILVGSERLSRNKLKECLNGFEWAVKID